jgi:hypothetical protein
MVDAPPTSIFDPFIVAGTFIGLLTAPDMVRPWCQTTISIAGHPVESIEEVYFGGKRVK